MRTNNPIQGSKTAALLIWAAVCLAISAVEMPGVVAVQARDPEVPSMEDLIKKGFDHVYSLDYDKAETIFQRIISAYPDDPAGYCYLSANIWLRYLHERQELEVGNFTSAAYFSKPPDKPLDPALVRQFEEYADRAAAKAQAILAREPRNVRALYFLGAAYGNIAAFHATAQRSLWTAFRYGGKAHECHEKVLKLDPQYYDAGLTVGLYDYIAGSIPWSVKWLAALIGYRGNKQEGLKYIRMAADKARYNRKDAQVIAVVLLVREKMLKEAIGYLEPLQKEYPRNPLLHVDLAGLYAMAGRHQDSISSYRDIIRCIRENRDHYERVPLHRVYYRLGDEYLAAGQIEDARKALDSGLSETKGRSPAAMSYHLRLGQVCDLLRDRPAAVSHYEEVLKYPVPSYQEQARRYLKEPCRELPQQGS